MIETLLPEACTATTPRLLELDMHGGQCSARRGWVRLVAD